MKKITILFSLAMFLFIANIVKAQNLIPVWNAGGAIGTGTEANKWGFASSYGAAVWGTAGGAGIRYRDMVNIAIDGGGTYTGREFLYRWDGLYLASVLSLGLPNNAGITTVQDGIPMVAGNTYTITGYYEWVNNASDPTYQFSFSDSANGTALVSGSFSVISSTTSLAVKNTYFPFTISFACTVSGNYFFQARQTAGLSGGTGGLIGFANLNLTSAITPPLGLKELDVTTDLKVYPNPVQNELNIVTNSDISRVSVYDLLGRSVLLKDKANGVNLKSIDVTGLKSGSYILNIVTTENKVEVLKFLK